MVCMSLLASGDWLFKPSTCNRVCLRASVTTFVEDNQGRIWIGVMAAGSVFTIHAMIEPLTVTGFDLSDWHCDCSWVCVVMFGSVQQAKGVSLDSVKRELVSTDLGLIDPSTHSNKILALLEDRQGHLWIATDEAIAVEMEDPANSPL